MTTIKEQVINSRTIRLYNADATSLLTDYDVTITKSDNGRAFIQCNNVDESQKVSDLFFTNNEYHNAVTYSLFFKSNTEFTDEESAKNAFLALCDTNITYMRLNTDLFSGKLVVDTLQDYNTFKSQNDNDGAPVKFYHFNSGKNARGRTRTRTNDVRAPRTNDVRARSNDVRTNHGTASSTSDI
jgi:hypothetical protein